jgi:Zn-finger nucleic acid-binding protein
MDAAGKKREFIELELKYCERCGGLWLRKMGEHAVYCGPCLPKVAKEAMERHAAGFKSRLHDAWKDEEVVVADAVIDAQMDGTLAEFEHELEHLLLLGVEGGNA